MKQNGEVSKETNGRLRLIFVTLFRTTISYEGDEAFLAAPSQPLMLCGQGCSNCRRRSVAKVEFSTWTEVVSGLTATGQPISARTPRNWKTVVGLQTDKPLKRAFMPYGGIKMAEQACTTYGYTPSEKLHEIFTHYCRTHNDGVFDAYTAEMKLVRHNHILTGLPDTYGRGRIVGDYRRVALYGIDFLIAEKKKDLATWATARLSTR
jgi:formate C-acetyltransferase